MMELYGLSSPNVMKVRIILEELDVPYNHTYIDIFAGAQYTEEFGKLNPNRKVPVLVDPDGPGGPITIIESGAILIYLAQKYDRFLPKSPTDYYGTIQWLMFQMASVGPMFGQTNHFLRTAPAGNDYSRDRYVTESKRIFDVLDERLSESEFLGCNEYSIADIATYPWARYYEPNNIDISKLKNLQRWLDQIGQRPVVANVVAYWPALRAVDDHKKETADVKHIDKLYGRGQFSRA
ncbi:glutathione S-transferase family protein [Mesorhizobium sp. M7A.F.Ca.US.006.01.1.1]|nr:glutathione S-transferase family protein [Mesorhizobium sp. M7A.F.Ca.US.006.01.1.1]